MNNKPFPEIVWKILDDYTEQAKIDGGWLIRYHRAFILEISDEEYSKWLKNYENTRRRQANDEPFLSK